MLALIGAMWTGFRALASRLGLEGSSWPGGLAALLATLVAFGLVVNVFGLFIRARHPDHFATLIAAIRSITTGDFGVTVDIKPDNPFGPVAGEINLMVQSLRKMEEMRQEFISTVSHEIQSPLTSIAGFAQGPARVGTDRGNEAPLSLDHRGGERPALAPVRRAVAADRPRLEGARTRWLRASPSTRRSARSSSPPSRNGTRRRLELDLELERVEAYGDEAMLAQVWTNLLHNAVKFSERGGRLAISLRRSGTLAVARFADEGAGIASGDLGLVFDRFFKADRSRSRSDAASGSGPRARHRQEDRRAERRLHPRRIGRPRRGQHIHRRAADSGLGRFRRAAQSLILDRSLSYTPFQ